MSYVSNASIKIKKIKKLKNVHRPFSELFRLLKRYDSSADQPMLAYTSHEMDEINQHANYAVDLLVQGLEGASLFLQTATPTQKLSEAVNQLGCLIFAISNLTEALSDLKSDADYVLGKGTTSHYQTLHNTVPGSG